MLGIILLLGQCLGIINQRIVSVGGIIPDKLLAMCLHCNESEWSASFVISSCWYINMFEGCIL